MININFTKKLLNFSLNIELKSNEKLLAIVGKSGSGKTSLIRCIAGLEKIDKGFIKVDNNEWHTLPIQKRDIGIVFQNYALFPNMTILENLQFANNDENNIQKLLSLMELTNLTDRYPDTLSGGEKQRVALARALLLNPKILLLDEPFSALNYELKQKLYEEIEIIKQNFDIQIIMISHDASEVYRLANRIIELEDGKIIKDFKPTHNVAKIVEKKENELIIEAEGKIYSVSL